MSIVGHAHVSTVGQAFPRTRRPHHIVACAQAPHGPRLVAFSRRRREIKSRIVIGRTANTVLAD